MTDAASAEGISRSSLPPAIFVYGPELSSYQLSPTHPFKPARVEATRDLIRHAGLLAAEQEVAPRPIGDKELFAVHDESYVELVKALSIGDQRPEAHRHGLGTGDNPIFGGMHEAILAVCAATCTAVDAVASGRAERAVSLSGGLHHALRDRASGFCLYNDLAVAMARASRRHGLRIAYVDVDAHHGDGVQWIFYDRADVMTVSVHESGRYLFPGTGHAYEVGTGEGRGWSVNVPLEPFTDDESFVEVFEMVVPRALRAYGPDLIVLQAGADMHRYDPLADLSLSTHGMNAAYERISALADELCGGRLVATGGGGYDAFRTVPRAWALLWAAISRGRLSDEVPAEWREAWQHATEQPLPDKVHDDVAAWPPSERRREVAGHNRVVAERLLSTLEPIWREQASTR